MLADELIVNLIRAYILGAVVYVIFNMLRRDLQAKRQARREAVACAMSNLADLLLFAVDEGQKATEYHLSVINDVLWELSQPDDPLRDV